MDTRYILVTGWLGYIGSHAVIDLVARWYTPIILDNLSASRKIQLQALHILLGFEPPFFCGSIGDEKIVRSLLTKFPIEGVWHFAAFKSPTESCQYPSKYFENNVTQLQKFLEILREYTVTHFIFSSSAAVYAPEDSDRPRTEDHPLWPIHPYGQSKHMGEILLQSYAKYHQFKVGILRYFNPIWSHDSWIIGEDPLRPAPNIFPILLDVLTQKREVLDVFWNDYPTIDGTGVRDYIHVQDLAEAHGDVYEYLWKNPQMTCEIFNIWTGIWTSVLEFVAACEKEIKKIIPIRFQPRRTGDLGHVIAASNHYHEVFWQKKYRSISTAIRSGYVFRTAPRILQIFPYFLPKVGGLELIGDEFSRQIEQTQSSVQMLLVGSHQQAHDFQLRNTVPMFTFPSIDILPNFPIPQFWTLKFWKTLRLIQAFQPSHCITHTRFFLCNLFPFIFFRSATWIHVEHGTSRVYHASFFVRKIGECIDATIGKWIARSAEIRIWVSEGARNFIAELSKKPAFTHYFWIRIQNDRGVRSENNLPKIVFLGRFVSLKGGDLFIRSLAELPKGSFEWHMYGEGECLEEYRKLLAEHQLEKTIIIHSKVSHDEVMNAILPHADILVQASFQEGLPTIVVESLLLGVCVVATRVGGTSEISSFPDLNLVESGSVQALTQGIVDMLWKYKEVRWSSREYIQNTFDSSKNTKVFLERYISN
jgi:UDP-glucose 4-epimerase